MDSRVLLPMPEIIPAASMLPSFFIGDRGHVSLNDLKHALEASPDNFRRNQVFPGCNRYFRNRRQQLGAAPAVTNLVNNGTPVCSVSSAESCGHVPSG